MWNNETRDLTIKQCSPIDIILYARYSIYDSPMHTASIYHINLFVGNIPLQPSISTAPMNICSQLPHQSGKRVQKFRLGLSVPNSFPSPVPRTRSVEYCALKTAHDYLHTEIVSIYTSLQILMSECSCNNS